MVAGQVVAVDMVGADLEGQRAPHGVLRAQNLGDGWVCLPMIPCVIISLLSLSNGSHLLQQDSDHGARTPRKPFAAASGGLYGGSVGMMPSDLAAAAGTPSNLGKIGDSGDLFLLFTFSYSSPFPQLSQTLTL